MPSTSLLLREELRSPLIAKRSLSKQVMPRCLLRVESCTASKPSWAKGLSSRSGRALAVTIKSCEYPYRCRLFQPSTSLQFKKLPIFNCSICRPYRFFNDMFNVGPSPGFWHLMRVFYDGDGYVVLPLPFRIFDEIVSLNQRCYSIHS